MGAAPREDPRTAATSSGIVSPSQRSPPPVFESYELVTVDLDPLAHHCPDDRIQAWAIAAAG